MGNERINEFLVKFAENIVKSLGESVAIGKNDKKEVLRILRLWRRNLKVILTDTPENETETYRLENEAEA